MKFVYRSNNKIYVHSHPKICKCTVLHLCTKQALQVEIMFRETSSEQERGQSLFYSSVCCEAISRQLPVFEADGHLGLTPSV